MVIGSLELHAPCAGNTTRVITPDLWRYVIPGISKIKLTVCVANLDIAYPIVTIYLTLV